MEYFGLYRGEIASIDDPDERYRYRVRIHPFHDASIQTERLPFAALCCFVGRNFGDVPHFEVGDKVIIAFEAGHRDHPIIMGSWVAGQEDQEGTLTPDFPEDQTDDYETRRKRWQRLDRDANEIRLTEGATAEDEESIRITSQKKLIIETIAGHLELNVSDDGSVTIGGSLTVVIEEDADITVQGDAAINVTGDAAVDVDGDLDAVVNGDIDIESETGAVNVTSTAGNVNVESTTGQVNVKSADVRLGNTPAEKVVTETRLATFFNAHTHPETGTTTGTPTVPLTPGVVNSPEVTAT